MAERVPVVLTVAGSDSGGGAGVQADMRAFNALGVWGTCAVTVVTAQNTLGVVESHHVPVKKVRAQMRAVADDFEVGWVKTGLLGSVKVAKLVADFTEKHGWNLVVDPVATAHAGGAPLWIGRRKKWLQAYSDLLVPRAYAVTPNVPEAAAITGITVDDVDSMKRAARALRELGAEVVVVTGGHLGTADVFFDGEIHVLGGKRVAGGTHGGGCTFAAAFTALLALGKKPLDAAQGAKEFTALAIRNSPEVGGGESPVWAGRR